MWVVPFARAMIWLPVLLSLLLALVAATRRLERPWVGLPRRVGIAVGVLAVGFVAIAASLY